MDFLIELLEKNSTIMELNLKSNNITHVGANKLFEFIWVIFYENFFIFFIKFFLFF